MNARVSDPSDRLRAICLALPLASEQAMKRGPTYRIENKIFAMDRPVDGRPSVWCKAPPGSQAVLIGADSARFFAPPSVGPKGWIGVRLDANVDWSEVEALLRRSHRLVAPKRLASAFK
jgi:predicted DNA-binding protein (MmcQ/YjbR family)